MVTGCQIWQVLAVSWLRHNVESGVEAVGRTEKEEFAESPEL